MIFLTSKELKFLLGCFNGTKLSFSLQKLLKFFLVKLQFFSKLATLDNKKVNRNKILFNFSRVFNIFFFLNSILSSKSYYEIISTKCLIVKNFSFSFECKKCCSFSICFNAKMFQKLQESLNLYHFNELKALSFFRSTEFLGLKNVPIDESFNIFSFSFSGVYCQLSL